MREKIKSQKGISMITLAVAVMIIIIITGILIYKSKDGIKIQKIQDLYNDISILREKISTYYLKYGTTPNYTEYTNIEDMKSSNVFGTNDIGKFYIIDLEKLDALTLNYGLDFERAKKGNYSSLSEIKDIYIINETSHNIFYVQGIEIEGKKYYTDQSESDSTRLDPRVVQGVQIPEGYHYVGGNKADGLVISDISDDDLQNSKGGNQFVWVPVENPDDIYGQLENKENAGKLYNFTANGPKPLNWEEQNKKMVVDSNSNREPSTIADDDGETESLNIIKGILTNQQEYYANELSFGQTLQEDYTNMLTSIEEYKGFFVGRFETSLDSNGKAQSKINKVPATAETTSANTWYGLYAKQKDFATSNSRVESSMIWGSQYDAMLKWILLNEQSEKILNSDEGNHSGTVANTGAYNNGSDIINNIYDLDGNVREWTLENSGDTTKNRVSRGGNFGDNGQRSMASRIEDSAKLTFSAIGSRMVLCKKVITPSNLSVANGATKFSTDYGTIDVIWLSGTSNTVTDTPNAPVLTSKGESMIPVKWTETTGGWVDSPVETTSSDISWYIYNAVSTREISGATTDNTTSKWANAKTANGSYFVWIPRYAYRITYYSSTTSTEPTGYYDGWGLWRASDGSVKLKLDNGVETVTYNGNKYIVHPAFGTNLDLGGWNSELSGFWFAKYEMSGDSYSELKSVPNVSSKRNQNIGTRYLWGRQATYGFNGKSETLSSNGTNYTYTSYMNSHLIKNSEWGAVAYLAHSQYGRNGNEIDINNSTSCITGNGGGAVGGIAETANGITNAYNTEKGAKASTTGNIYGIYDMSDGAWDCVASFCSEGMTDYIEDSSFGLLMTQEAKDNSGNYISTKYITKYGGTSSHYGNKVLYYYGKTGDSTKEVNIGGQDINSSEIYREGWFSDYGSFVKVSDPVFRRGGSYNHNGQYSGVFSNSQYNGGHADNYAIRVALCP